MDLNIKTLRNLRMTKMPHTSNPPSTVVTATQTPSIRPGRSIAPCSGQEGELHVGHHKDGLDKRKMNSPPWELSENAHVNLPSSCLT